jgi:hypothetical protein
MPSSRNTVARSRRNAAHAVEFARLVERGLREDLRRLHTDLLDEESRLTALEEIRWHSMKDFEAMSEQGVTTAEAALYYTLFHHLTQEINLQGRLVVTAQHRVRDKQAAVQAASADLLAAERAGGQAAADGRRSTSSVAVPAPWGTARPMLKKAS